MQETFFFFCCYFLNLFGWEATFINSFRRSQGNHAPGVLVCCSGCCRSSTWETNSGCHMCPTRALPASVVTRTTQEPQRAPAGTCSALRHPFAKAHAGGFRFPSASGGAFVLVFFRIHCCCVLFSSSLLSGFCPKSVAFADLIHNS